MTKARRRARSAGSSLDALVIIAAGCGTVCHQAASDDREDDVVRVEGVVEHAPALRGGKPFDLSSIAGTSLLAGCGGAPTSPSHCSSRLRRGFAEWKS